MFNVVILSFPVNLFMYGSLQCSTPDKLAVRFNSNHILVSEYGTAKGIEELSEIIKELPDIYTSQQVSDLYGKIGEYKGSKEELKNHAKRVSRKKT